MTSGKANTVSQAGLSCPEGPSPDAVHMSSKLVILEPVSAGASMLFGAQTQSERFWTNKLIRHAHHWGGGPLAQLT